MNKVVSFFAVFLMFVSGAKANDFLNNFLEPKSQKHGTEDELFKIISKGSFVYNKNDEDFLLVSKVQLTLEQALNDCINSGVCKNVKIIFKSKNPLLSLRIKNLQESPSVTQTQDPEINYTLLKRKEAILSLTNAQILIANSVANAKIKNYAEYVREVSNFPHIVSCFGCYDFVKRFKAEGSIYYFNVDGIGYEFVVKKVKAENANDKDKFVIEYIEYTE